MVSLIHKRVLILPFFFIIAIRGNCLYRNLNDNLRSECVTEILEIATLSPASSQLMTFASVTVDVSSLLERKDISHHFLADNFFINFI